MKKEHQLVLHGWPGDKAYCDFANWWDCSFWCGNDKVFGNEKDPCKRFCPMGVPTFDTCPKIIKNKKKNNKGAVE